MVHVHCIDPKLDKGKTGAACTFNSKEIVGVAPLGQLADGDAPLVVPAATSALSCGGRTQDRVGKHAP